MPARQHDADMLDPDSAYGGSDVGNSTESSRENVPTITKSDAVRQNMPTKQQFDTASGRVITTTTTTTTTTVTTLGGDEISVPAGQEVVVTKDETITPHEMSARPLSKEIQEEELREDRRASWQGQQYQGGSGGVGSDITGNQSPPIPDRHLKRRSQSPKTSVTGQGHHTRRLSNDRRDGGISPSGHHNFSYPARTPPPQGAVSPQRDGPQRGRFSYEDVPVPPVPGNLQETRSRSIPKVPVSASVGTQDFASGSQDVNRGSYEPYRNDLGNTQNSSRPRRPVEPSLGQPGLNGQPAREQPAYGGERPQSTLQSLKFAAAGIHGAGETLRGALNSNIDRRTGASEAQLAKHNAVLDRGRQEIETGHLQRPSNSSMGSSSVSEPEELMHTPTQTPEKRRISLRNVLRKKSRDREGLGAVQE
ncbi:Sphingolipid C9-methyltransferase 2 [Venturia nashicola]|uniref:Sphingolipid C9-methyltransferase 2 n=1 Tax=Venturia nashicola TaxID=86259 RepID=A0A4Z1PFN8_9PEZI|nr:Sphingolipid C9-methyltransferase 2 [Venturia nashicola]